MFPFACLFLSYSSLLAVGIRDRSKLSRVINICLYYAISSQKLQLVVNGANYDAGAKKSAATLNATLVQSFQIEQ